MANMAEMLSAGAVRYVANLRRGGYTRRSIRRALLNRYPNSSNQSIEGVINRADAAMLGAAALAAKARDVPLMAKEIRKPDPGCIRWRYFYAIEWTDTTTGRTGTVSSDLTRDTSQSTEQIESEAGKEFEKQRGQQKFKRFSKRIPAGAVLTRVAVLTVERACP